MLPEAVNLALLCLVAVSAIACIRGQYAGRARQVYLWKPLTMVWVLALAAQAGAEVPTSYRVLVLAALCFSLAGDVLLMLPDDRFAAGLASFLVAHLLYVAAFAGEAGPTAAPGALAFFAVFGIGMLAYLWPGLGRLRIPVCAYVGAIVAMVWQATARALAVGDLAAWLACLGACLFVFSDAVLAANRFRHPFAAAQALILGSYFSGQAAIALSVGVGEALLGP